MQKSLPFFQCFVNFFRQMIRRKSPIILTVDEYETIRLWTRKVTAVRSSVQYLYRSQEQTTVQRIYEITRKKIADALFIDGHQNLELRAGIRICDGQEDCNLRMLQQELYQKYAVEKGEGIMRTAVTYENGQTADFPLGINRTFKIYDVEEGKWAHSEVGRYQRKRHGALGRSSYPCIEYTE